MSPLTVSADKERKIEKFLYREALLLDQSRVDEWLKLFADDAVYLAPIIETLDHRVTSDIFEEGRFCIFEEDKNVLTKRAQRLKTNYAHAEQPRSRVRRLITNILVTSDQNGEVEVHSNFLVFQSRRESTDVFLWGIDATPCLSQAKVFSLNAEKLSLLIGYCLAAYPFFFKSLLRNFNFSYEFKTDYLSHCPKTRYQILT